MRIIGCFPGLEAGSKKTKGKESFMRHQLPSWRIPCVVSAAFPRGTRSFGPGLGRCMRLLFLHVHVCEFQEQETHCQQKLGCSKRSQRQRGVKTCAKNVEYPPTERLTDLAAQENKQQAGIQKPVSVRFHSLCHLVLRVGQK